MPPMAGEEDEGEKRLEPIENIDSRGDPSSSTTPLSADEG